MLDKLYTLAQTRSEAYRAAKGELTKDPIATEEIVITLEDYKALREAEQKWWDTMTGSDKIIPDSMPEGVAVADYNTPFHMVFVGTYQISLIINEVSVRRQKDGEVFQFEPHTLAKVVVYDYKYHPDRVFEYFTKSTTAWSMEQYTTGFGLGYLKSQMDQVDSKQPEPSYER